MLIFCFDHCTGPKNESFYAIWFLNIWTLLKCFLWLYKYNILTFFISSWYILCIIIIIGWTVPNGRHRKKMFFGKSLVIRLVGFIRILFLRMWIRSISVVNCETIISTISISFTFFFFVPFQDINRKTAIFGYNIHKKKDLIVLSVCFLR